MQIYSRLPTVILCCLFFLIAHSGALAKDKEPKTYPVHGSIVAVHVGAKSNSVPVYTDPYGKSHGGFSESQKTHTYRIETDTLVYDLTERSKKPSFSVGDSVEFRVEKEKAYIRDRDKERKYDITGTERKPSL